RRIRTGVTDPALLAAWSEMSMSNDSSLSRKTEVERNVALAWAAAAGKLDGLPCPRCQAQTVSVWFTHRASDYFTWFTCANCGYETRVQGDKPSCYLPERDRTDEMVVPESAVGTKQRS